MHSTVRQGAQKVMQMQRLCVCLACANHARLTACFSSSVPCHVRLRVLGLAVQFAREQGHISGLLLQQQQLLLPPRCCCCRGSPVVFGGLAQRVMQKYLCSERGSGRRAH